MADSSKPRANTAFDNSSFPQPLNPLPETQYPPSIISSRMTDAGSEDGEDFRPPSSRPATSGRPMSSRPAPGPLVGDRPGDSRPSTALSSHRGTPSQPPPSRRGVLGLNGVRSSNVGSVSGSIGTARPPSAASRTHVPSLTSHAFFKPMSSQRLQAQRNVRATAEPAKEPEEYHEVETNPNRYSFSSNPTTRYGPVVHQEHDPMPESRDTNATDREALGTSHTNPDGHGPSQSLTESVRPLQQGPKNNNHGLNAGTAYRSGGMASAASKPVSQPSFRSSFKLSSRVRTKTGIEQGREKLSSTSSSPRQGPTKMDMAKSQNRKNYEYFTGNTSFCWGGRLQNAHDRPINILTGLIVVLPVALFFGFSAPWLWKHASPAVPVVFAYVFAVCISSFVHASVTDPGILPRNLHQFPPMAADEDPLALGPPTMAWTTIKSIGTPGLVMEELTKHCKTCNIWRPPRAHHCRVCNNCVETQDHHCVWLNNCIGRRNYRYFFAFVSSGTIVGLYLIGASLAHLLLYHKMQADSFGKAINHNRVVFALVIYGLLATPYPASLLGYHLFLMGKGETTRELLNSHKVAPKDRHRPFTTGNLFTNWVVVLGRPRPPTYLHFKRKYEEGDQRFGSERGRRKAPLKKQHPQGGMEMEPVKAVAHPTAAPPMNNNATSGEQTS